ncbi:MAG TPA: hypothetical protein VL122_00380 [Nitrospirota bacterium]|nr:hypothetical protein [Nitrospirota bacterium]
MMALAVMAVTIFLLGNMESVFAESGWAKDHPRRHEVNKRLANQNRRINKKVRNGDMTKAEAGKLHKEDRNIRQKERDMAKQNGGHITKQEQRALNQQENKNSRQIAN